jgi:chemosensory pili system protein ChpA (sensor histidine kinase/response regulator)
VFEWWKAKAGLMKRLIRVADDDEYMRAAHTSVLESCGYAVLRARDGQDAITLARIRAPDLVLMDLEMPRMNGFEAVAALRSQRTTAEIPVIMMTARDDAGTRAKAFILGCAAFLVKPLSLVTLLDEIGRHLHHPACSS